MAYQYILTQNRASVLLGPMFWRQRMFQAELTTLEEDGELAPTIKYVVPTEEQGYVLISSNVDQTPQFEFWPILNVDQPTFDPLSELLA